MLWGKMNDILFADNKINNSNATKQSLLTFDSAEEEGSSRKGQNVADTLILASLVQR